MRLRSENARAVCVSFTSTHPVRGATYLKNLPMKSPWGLHPRTSWEVRLLLFQKNTQLSEFPSTHPVRDVTKPRSNDTMVPDVYIHAPRERCDVATRSKLFLRSLFTSTHLVRGATWIIHHMVGINWFTSTHPVRDATCCRMHCFEFTSTHLVRDAMNWWL